jgi:SAM-dependent methyltransferase
MAFVTLLINGGFVQMNKLHILLTVLFIFILINSAWARYCSSPNCRMCNRIFGPMPGYNYNGLPITQSQRYSLPPIPNLEESFDQLYTKFSPSQMVVVKKALQIANPSKREIIYDLGCGDARVLIEAMRSYNIAGLGAEINPKIVKLAQRKVNESGFSKSIRIVEMDVTKLKIKANIVYIYLFPDIIKNLDKSLGDARIVISFCHDIPQLKTQKVQFVDGNKMYVFYIYVNQK